MEAVCLSVCVGISEGPVWTERVSTVNPASYLQATAGLTPESQSNISFMIRINPAQRLHSDTPPSIKTQQEVHQISLFIK